GKLAFVDPALDPRPLCLARGHDAELQHQRAVWREPFDQRTNQRRLVIGIVQRRCQQDYVELPFWKMLPTLLVELAFREPLTGAFDEQRGTVDPDRALRALETREAAEEPLVATHVEERTPLKTWQPQRLELVECSRVARGIGKGLVLGVVGFWLLH